MSDTTSQPRTRPRATRSLWRLVASLRLGIALLIVVAVASTVGVVLPQPESFSFADYERERLAPRAPRRLEPKEFVALARAAGLLPRPKAFADFVAAARSQAPATGAIEEFYRSLIDRAKRAQMPDEKLPELFFAALTERARRSPLTDDEWPAFYAEGVRRIEAGELKDEVWPTLLSAFSHRVLRGKARTACLRLAYVDSYGRLLGRLLVAARIHVVFTSAWFRLLCLALIVNLVSCSLRRLPAQWRAAFGQPQGTSPKWYLNRAIHTAVSLPPPVEQPAQTGGDALAQLGVSARASGVDAAATRVEAALVAGGFQVRRRRATGMALLEGTRGCLGELGRVWWPLRGLAGLGRLGSQVVHLGVVLVMVGGFISGRLSFRHPQLMGRDEIVAVPDLSYRLSLGYQFRELRDAALRSLGQEVDTEPLRAERAAADPDWRETPGKPGREAAFRLRLRRFEFRQDTRGKPEYYGAHVSILDTTPTTDEVIEVNRPLIFGGFHTYQQSYQPDYRRVSSVSVLVARVRRAGEQSGDSHSAGDPGEVLSQISVSVPPDTDVRVPGTDLTLRVTSYFPHWQMTLEQGPDGRRVQGEATNLSDQPNNPAVRLRIQSAQARPLERWVMLPFRPNEPRQGGIVDYGDYRILPLDFKPDYATWLTFKTHPVMLPVWIGCGVMMLGIVLCFYCNHERVWALVHLDDEGACEVYLAGNAFKWRERFKERFAAIAAAVDGDDGDTP